MLGSRARDALLAGTLLSVAIAFGWLAGARIRYLWLLGGIGATLGAETVAYRRASAVRSAFDRPSVVAVTTAVGGAAIGTGAIVVPHRSLSVAVGALGTYLLLLGWVTVDTGSSVD